MATRTLTLKEKVIIITLRLRLNVAKNQKLAAMIRALAIAAKSIKNVAEPPRDLCVPPSIPRTEDINSSRGMEGGTVGVFRAHERSY
jgi:hypothetical protein